MRKIDGMDALDALKLQIAWGADEALLDTPVDRLAATAPALRVQPARLASGGIVGEAAALAMAATTREALRDALASLDCPLRHTATTTVFADGNPDSGLMLVGEAPGADEDRAGLPFVGASGRFLDRMLASIGLDRSRYLITNLIPWRPPGNRNPTDNEVLLCLPFLQRHMALVQPRHVVLLGSLATRAVTGNTAGIRRLRGPGGWR